MRSLSLRSASAPGGWRATRLPGHEHAVVAPGRGRRGLCGAAPPASSPLRVPVRPAPPRNRSLLMIVTVASGSRPEGPDGPGVNGLTPGPLRLLGRLSPAGQGLPQVTRAPPSPSICTASDRLRFARLPASAGLLSPAGVAAAYCLVDR
jgi:hypothetical protein